MAEDTIEEPTSETEEESAQPAKSEIPPEVAAALKRANKEAETLRRKLKEIEDAGKPETQRATEEAATARADAVKARADYLRLKVGTDKGLPPALAARLHGETEEDMAADADALLQEWRPKRASAPSFEAGVRNGTTATSGSFLTDAIRRQRRG